MLLDPPFDRLRRPSPDDPPPRDLTVPLPPDLHAWLAERCGDDAAAQADYVTLALDCLRQFEGGRGWPGLQKKPGPRTPEQVAALRAELDAIRVEDDGEPDGFDDWLRERQEERDRLAAIAKSNGWVDPEDEVCDADPPGDEWRAAA